VLSRRKSGSRIVKLLVCFAEAATLKTQVNSEILMTAPQRGLLIHATPCREGNSVTLKIKGGNTYSSGGARLGEKYKSKYEAKGVSRRETPQTKRTQAMAITKLISVRLNCPVANADMKQK